MRLSLVIAKHDTVSCNLGLQQTNNFEMVGMDTAAWPRYPAQYFYVKDQMVNSKFQHKVR